MSYSSVSWVGIVGQHDRWVSFCSLLFRNDFWSIVFSGNIDNDLLLWMAMTYIYVLNIFKYKQLNLRHQGLLYLCINETDCMKCLYNWWFKIIITLNNIRLCLSSYYVIILYIHTHTHTYIYTYYSNCQINLHIV